MWSLYDKRIGTSLCYILSISTLCSGYVITTPKRWTVEEEGQVCVILSAPATSEETITFEMKEIVYDFFPPFGEYDEYDESSEDMFLILPTIIVVPQGEQSICQNIYLPSTLETSAEFTISGSLEGENATFTRYVAITSEILQTFIQTDKYLYKPSQIVQFRILTVIGVFLQVSLESYEEIWIENPSGIRLAQWLNVTNENGLIHLSFQLSDEPKEGEYIIKVQTSSGKLYNRIFKVEEYVLPRFEVKINPPNYILGTTEIITFEVCAEYTFGQPVNGNVSISVDNNRGGPNDTLTKEDEISGCTSFNINASELSINDDENENNNYNSDYYGGGLLGGGLPFYNPLVNSLTVNAFVTEEGTGIKLEANEKSVKISRTALRFKDISVQKYYKPELPYLGEVEVTFPDGSPAPDEPMTICCNETCANRSTNDEGILKFAIPPHLDCDITIFAPNYPRIRANNSGYNIMNKSGFRKSIKKYHSPSNSSLVIILSNENLECVSTEERITFNLTVMFAANQQDSASVTVQVISRGQIQFSETSNQTFTADSISSINDSLFIEPVQEPSDPNLIRGYFTVLISLPKTVSPEAQILVWYARDDGEVVSDARDISIMECLLNSVNIEWSTDEALPGANVSLSVTAEPLSLCSLGVVDKSVELLTPKKYLLTIKRLLKLVQKASVKSYDYQQVNDFEYCQNQQTGGGLLSNPETTPPSTISSTSSSTSTTSSSTSSSTSSTTSTPCKRKKREAVPSNVKSENLRRSKRSLIGLPIFPLYYSDDVDALHMCDEAGVYCLSNLILETRPCQDEGSSFDYDYYYFSYNYYNDYYYYYYGDNHDYGLYGGLLGGIGGGNPGGGPEGLEGDGDEDEEETDEIRTYFPETWLWSLFSVSSDGSYEEDLIVPDTVTEWVGRALCVHPSKGVGISNPATFKTFKEFFVDLTLPPSVKRGEIFHVKISVFNYLNESLPIWLILKSPDDKFDILADTGSEGGSGVKTACVPANDKTVVSIRIQAREVGDVNISVKAEVMENATDSCGSGNVQQKRDILIKPIRVNFEGFLVEETQFKFVCTNDSENVLETWNVTAPDSIVPDSARGFAAVVGDLLGPTLENLGNLVQMPYGCGEQNMINFAPNIFVVQYLRASNQDDEDIADRAIEFMKQGYQRELNYRHSDGSFSVFGESDESGSTWLTAFVLKCFGQASAYIAVDQNDLNLTSEWLKSLQNDDGCFESVGRLFNKAMQGGVDSESPSLLTAYVMISLIEAGESNNSTVISEALSCINDAETTTNPYSLAIKAYALALAKSPDTQAILDELMNISTNSDVGLYWEFPNQYESSNGVAVETASYAVLAILTYTQSFSDYSYMKHVLPIIKWINTQRNGQGGFVSTQDTIIALQALAAFQKLLSVSGGPTDLTVSVTMGNVSKTFSINEQNKLLQQSVAFPTVPISITFDVDGEGCALLQAVLRYNVQEGEINEAFSLNVTTTTEPGATCETKRIKVCTAYILPDKSNMAIIEIDVVSGYIPERADLDELVGNGTGLFKRKEIDVSKVKIYVEEITAEEICLSFRIRKGPDVENPKPGTVKVYDYYKPENQASKRYTLPPPTECAD